MPFTSAARKREWDRADWHRHPERAIARNLRRGDQRRTNLANRYGLSIAEYERMADAQGGVCACCGKTPSTKKRLSVDHNHTNGEVRALICDRCNSAVSVLEHPDLPKWQAYLASHARMSPAAGEFATATEIAAYLGTRNWVVTRKTAKVIARYGADVVCLSPQRYKAMQTAILADRP